MGTILCVKLEQALVPAPPELRVPSHFPDVRVCHGGGGASLEEALGCGEW